MQSHPWVRTAFCKYGRVRYCTVRHFEKTLLRRLRGHSDEGTGRYRTCRRGERNRICGRTGFPKQSEHIAHMPRRFRFLKRLSKSTYYTETQKLRRSLPGAISKNTLKILKSPRRTTCPRNGRCAPKFCFAQEASLGLQPISAC